MLPTTTTAASPVCTRRQVCGLMRSRRRKSASRAAAKDGPHGDDAPDGEGRRRPEEQDVDHIRRACDPEAGDVDHDRGDQGDANKSMDAPPGLTAEARQIAARQQRLEQQERHGDDAREPGRDVNGLAPRQQRARRRGAKRHDDGRRECGPDHYGAGPAHPSEPC